MKDKELKKQVLMDLMKSIGDNVMKNDISPILEKKKTKMIIKAEGDSPEDVKEEVIKKLSKMDLPDTKEIESEECPYCEGEGCSECEGEEEDYMAELPDFLKKSKMKK